MRILFITSAHNSLSQRLQVELADRGHGVAVHLATSDEAMGTAVEVHQPDLIVAAIPRAIWQRHTCLIVHPGIKGDRGPSSLDWAIALGEPSWGVTILQAVAEMDAGPIWAAEEFPLPKRPDSKGGVYRGVVTIRPVCRERQSWRKAFQNNKIGPSVTVVTVPFLEQ